MSTFGMFGVGIPSSLRKLVGISSSGSEIDAVANVIDTKLTKVHQLFRQASNGVNSNVKLIVSSDSTNSASYSKFQEYYTKQMAKVNVSYYDNSFPGQTAYDWLNNIDNNTLQQAIDNSSGTDGEDTIMIFSLGINDYNGTNTQEDIKNLLSDGIEAYLSAKPKANIILLRPNRTGSDTLSTWLGEIYTELSLEFNLFLVDAYAITKNKWNNPIYYYDSTHPNKWGARAIMNNTFSKIVPLDLMNKLTLEEYDGTSINWSSYCLKAKLQSGYWNQTTAAYTSDSNWYSLEEVSVTAGDVLVCSHLGNRTNFVYANDAGTLVVHQYLSFTNRTLISTVPTGATKVRINISSSASAYSLLEDIPTLHKQTIDDNIYCDLRTINVQQKLPNRVISTRYGIIVDGYGKIGAVGESLKIDSNNKTKWSV